jgi:predicted methyltransferase
MISESELDNVAQLIASKLVISISQVKTIYHADLSNNPDWKICAETKLELPIVNKVRTYLKEFGAEDGVTAGV